jgi:hypothetical protein
MPYWLSMTYEIYPFLLGKVEKNTYLCINQTIKQWQKQTKWQDLKD